MSHGMRWYLLGLSVAAVGLWLLLLVGGVGDQRPARPGLALVLVALSVVAYQFPVLLTRDWKVHAASGPLLAGAFLFSAAEGLALAFLAALVGNALLRLPQLPRPVQRRPWWNCLLN